ncbi:MAG: OB-fold domain-containing protein [Elusimicrobia bacterium]|nr:OB-fold domain-containing protein [Elusimicrobiota bacterium]
METARLKLKTCAGCAKLMQPPVFHCPACGSAELRDRELEAKGEIYTLSTVYATFGSWGKKVPFTLAVVELPETLRVIGVVEDPDAATRPFRIGDRVRFARYDEGQAPIFARDPA